MPIAGLVGKVVTSLEFAITNPECEMERPSDWIDNDPDFACLRSRRSVLRVQALPGHPKAARLSTIHGRGCPGLATEQRGQYANRRHRTNRMMLGGSGSDPQPQRPRANPRKRTFAALETSIRRGRTVKVQVVGLHKSSPRGFVRHAE